MSACRENARIPDGAIESLELKETDMSNMKTAVLAFIVSQFHVGGAMATSNFSTSKFEDIGLACADANKLASQNNGRMSCSYTRTPISSSAAEDGVPNNGKNLNYASMSGEIVSVIWKGSDGIPRLAIQVLGNAYKQCNGDVLYQKKSSSTGQSNPKSECNASNTLSKSVGIRVFAHDSGLDKLRVYSDSSDETTFKDPKFACFVSGGRAPSLPYECTSLGGVSVTTVTPASSVGTIGYNDGFSFSGSIDPKGSVSLSPTFSFGSSRSLPNLSVDQRQNGQANVSWIYTADKYTGSIPNGEFVVFQLPGSVIEAEKVTVGFGVEYTMWMYSTIGKPFMKTLFSTISTKGL
jgi:hypothetical protein